MNATSYTPIIDLSHWKRVTDWRAVAASTCGVYMKASEGTSFRDAQYIPVRNACLSRLLPFGAYHFFQPGVDGETQARHILKVVGEAPPPELLPAVDCERHPGPGDLAFDNLRAFLRVVFQETGLCCVVYTSASWWDAFMPDEASAIAEQHPLWVAHYTDADKPRLPRHWQKWTMWQYTDKGRVECVSGGVDLNWLNGPISTLLAKPANSVTEEPMEPILGKVVEDKPAHAPWQGEVTRGAVLRDEHGVAADAIQAYPIGAAVTVVGELALDLPGIGVSNRYVLSNGLNIWKRAVKAVPAKPAKKVSWVWPVESKRQRINHAFDEPRPKYASTLPKGKVHEGVDIFGKLGDPVKAVADGVVLEVNHWNRVQTGRQAYGNFVVIQQDEYTVLYAHLRFPPALKVGQEVKQGQRIGEVGSTGNSTGPHLHIHAEHPGAPPHYVFGQKCVNIEDLLPDPA